MEYGRRIEFQLQVLIFFLHLPQCFYTGGIFFIGKRDFFIQKEIGESETGCAGFERSGIGRRHDQMHRVLSEQCLQHVLRTPVILQNCCPDLFVRLCSLQYSEKELFREEVNRKVRTDYFAAAAGECLPLLLMKEFCLILPVNIHERMRFRKKLLCADLIMLHIFFGAVEHIPSGSLVPRDGSSFERSNAGHFQKMQKHLVLRSGKIIWRDLPCHIKRDPALETQHHLREGPVHVVDLMEMKAFLQHECHAKHILFRKFRIGCHLFKRHIAVQNTVLI